MRWFQVDTEEYMKKHWKNEQENNKSCYLWLAMGNMVDADRSGCENILYYFDFV